MKHDFDEIVYRILIIFGLVAAALAIAFVGWLILGFAFKLWPIQ